MKHLLAAAAALASVATIAVAQTTPATPPNPPAAPAAPAAPVIEIPPSRCPGFPAAPTLPPAAEVKNMRELNAGTEAFNTWQLAMQEVSNCRQAEARELQAAAQAAAALSNARINEFNEAQRSVRAIGGQWQATHAEASQRLGGNRKR